MAVLKYKDSNGNWVPVGGSGGTNLQDEIKDILASSNMYTVKIEGNILVLEKEDVK